MSDNPLEERTLTFAGENEEKLELTTSAPMKNVDLQTPTFTGGTFYRSKLSDKT